MFKSLSVYSGVRWGNDGSVDMRDKVCSNHSVFPCISGGSISMSLWILLQLA